MTFSLYSIRDFKTGYLAPVCEVNQESAIRNFEAACLRSDSLFFSHPEDYALFHLGYYDSESGDLVSCVPCEVVTAVQAIQSALAHSYVTKGVSSDGQKDS